MAKEKVLRACEFCKEKFWTARERHRFCTRVCNNKWWLATQYKPSQYSGTLAAGTVGAIGELRVCVDLMNNGDEVFRAVSPSCSCDLAILRKGKILRVEVRTGSERKNGTIYAPQPKNVRADILAIVLPHRILYEDAPFKHGTKERTAFHGAQPVPSNIGGYR